MSRLAPKENCKLAFDLQNCPYVPRTEYSAHMHWDLIKAVTGIDTGTIANRPRAERQFIKDWEYGFIWDTPASSQLLERYGKITDMGHAEYSENSAGVSDTNEHVATLFKTVDEALQLDCTKFYGEFDKAALAQEFTAAYEKSCAANPDALNMGGVYINTISGLTFIFGWEMLLECIAYPEFENVIASYQEWLRQIYDAYAMTDIPYFMYHDDICWTSGQFAAPAWYERNVFAHMRPLVDTIKRSGKKVLYTSDGDYTAFFDQIVDCGADILVFEPCADMEGFAKKYGKTHGFVGNVDVRTLMTGDKTRIRREVEAKMAFGKQYPGFILAVGNHIPPNTPVDAALYYDDIYRELRDR